MLKINLRKRKTSEEFRAIEASRLAQAVADQQEKMAGQQERRKLKFNPKPKRGQKAMSQVKAPRKNVLPTSLESQKNVKSKKNTQRVASCNSKSAVRTCKYLCRINHFVDPTRKFKQAMCNSDESESSQISSENSKSSSDESSGVSDGTDSVHRQPQVQVRKREEKQSRKIQERSMPKKNQIISCANNNSITSKLKDMIPNPWIELFNKIPTRNPVSKRKRKVSQTDLEQQRLNLIKQSIPPGLTEEKARAVGHIYEQVDIYDFAKFKNIKLEDLDTVDLDSTVLNDVQREETKLNYTGSIKAFTFNPSQKELILLGCFGYDKKNGLFHFFYQIKPTLEYQEQYGRKNMLEIWRTASCNAIKHEQNVALAFIEIIYANHYPLRVDEANLINLAFNALNYSDITQLKLKFYNIHRVQKLHHSTLVIQYHDALQAAHSLQLSDPYISNRIKLLQAQAAFRGYTFVEEQQLKSKETPSLLFLSKNTQQCKKKFDDLANKLWKDQVAQEDSAVVGPRLVFDKLKQKRETAAKLQFAEHGPKKVTSITDYVASSYKTATNCGVSFKRQYFGLSATNMGPVGINDNETCQNLSMTKKQYADLKIMYDSNPKAFRKHLVAVKSTEGKSISQKNNNLPLYTPDPHCVQRLGNIATNIKLGPKKTLPRKSQKYEDDSEDDFVPGPKTRGNQKAADHVINTLMPPSNYLPLPPSNHEPFWKKDVKNNRIVLPPPSNKKRPDFRQKKAPVQNQVNLKRVQKGTGFVQQTLPTNYSPGLQLRSREVKKVDKTQQSDFGVPIQRNQCQSQKLLSMRKSELRDRNDANGGRKSGVIDVDAQVAKSQILNLDPANDADDEKPVSRTLTEKCEKSEDFNDLDLASTKGKLSIYPQGNQLDIMDNDFKIQVMNDFLVQEAEEGGKKTQKYGKKGKKGQKTSKKTTSK